MATATATRNLTQAHRLAQLRLGAATVVLLRSAWRLLDPDDLDGTFDEWVATALTLLEAQRAKSATIAANYLATFKEFELGAGATLTPVLASELPIKAARTSLLVTGPVSIKAALGRGVNLAAAREVAEAASSAAGMRHALNGGRETITRTVKADRDARGWARITSAKPCDFCSMLASRGAVYKGTTADFEAHDGCNCTAEPLYR